QGSRGDDQIGRVRMAPHGDARVRRGARHAGEATPYTSTGVGGGPDAPARAVPRFGQGGSVARTAPERAHGGTGAGGGARDAEQPAEDGTGGSRRGLHGPCGPVPPLG